MRFGNNELNITTLALPDTTTPNYDTDILNHISPDDVRKFMKTRGQADAETKTRFLGLAKLFFLHKLVLTPEEEDRIWEQGFNEIGAIKQQCTESNDDYYNWDVYIRHLSFLKLINPTKSKSLAITEFEWRNILGNYVYDKTHYNWEYMLNTARAVTIVDPPKKQELGLTDELWQEIKGVWREHLKFARESASRYSLWTQLLEIMADARVLYGDKFTQLFRVLTADDWKKIKEVSVTLGSEDPFRHLDFLTNLRIALATRVEVTENGLEIDASPPETLSYQDSSTPPLQRNF